MLSAAALALLLSPACEIATVHLDGRDLLLEVANIKAERSKGLMFRDDLAPYDGMIFVYPEPRHVQFWMKNTPLALDMLFFDSSGQLVTRHDDAKPFDRTPIDGGRDVQLVIELPADSSHRIGGQLSGVLCHAPT